MILVFALPDWKSKLAADATDWLLEDDNPSVRYFTLTDLLDKPQTDEQTQKAKVANMKVGLVPKILSKQNMDGSWETPTAFYTAKYKGTSWQLLILAELGADKEDFRVRSAWSLSLEVPSTKKARVSPWRGQKKPVEADKAA